MLAWSAPFRRACPDMVFETVRLCGELGKESRGSLLL